MANGGHQSIHQEPGDSEFVHYSWVETWIITLPFQLFALETMRDRYWHNMAARIQRAWRNYLRYRNECARRIQRFWKNNKESITYAQIRDHGYELLGQRKERRRFSLLGYRRFMGDYLDVNGRSALGEELGEAAEIGSTYSFHSYTQDLIVLQEIPSFLVVVFTYLYRNLAGQVKLVPGFLFWSVFLHWDGFSSVDVGRQTAKALHLLVTNMKDGQAITTLERKINLITIKSISLSNLRDDWLVCCDPVIYL